MGIATTAMAAIGLTKKATLIMNPRKSPTKENPEGGAKKALMAGGIFSAQTVLEAEQKLQVDKYSLKLQYNPSSISFKASGQTVTTNALESNIHGGIGPQTTYAPGTIMSVELIFDDTNINDCFNSDTGGFSVGGMISGAVNVVNAFGNWKHSVLKQTQGLLSLLNQSDAQDVIFCWNDMAFQGMVSEAQARYTLFSTCGEPVRSSVVLKLISTVETERQEKQARKKLENEDMDTATKMIVKAAVDTSAG